MARRPSQRAALLLTLLLTACSDSPGANPIQGADQGADMAPDQAMEDMSPDAAPAAPALENLPATQTGHAGRPDSFALVSSGAGPLGFTLDGSACGFEVRVDADGLIAWTCPAALSTCVVTVTVSDTSGQRDTDQLTITCDDQAPSASQVTIRPGAIPVGGASLTCSYVFSDPDGDADMSTIEWLVNGEPVATGPAFSDYEPGDSVACRVTPHDGVLAGPPVTSPALLAPLRPAISAISANAEHTCAIKSGALYCWGNNEGGQLGTSAHIGIDVPNAQPHRVLESGVTAVAAGRAHTCAIQDGALKCWGDNASGQLGVSPDALADTDTPQTVFAADTTAVVAGDGHTCAIHQGALTCWGKNTNGQLGVGVHAGNSTPTPTPQTVFSSGVTAISAGFRHTCAIHDGALKCWGDNTNNQLGADAAMSLNATPLTVFDADVQAVAAGGSHTCAIHQGALKCWGANRVGQLGADGSDTATPQTVLDADVSAVSAGYSHTCAVQDGALKCWGNNYAAQLATDLHNGSLTPNPTPRLILPAEVSAVAAGRDHTCAVHEGALKCWGDNKLGRLGAPGASGSPSAVPVTAIAMPDAIGAGYAHTCAIHQGALECWGDNQRGQLGAVTNGDTPTPQLALPADVTAVAPGGAHTCAIHDGALKCWGSNSAGQLGTAINVGISTPQRVLDAGVTAVAAGNAHTCAIHDGALKCWGANTSGQLGTTLNNATDTAAPQLILPTDVTLVSAGGGHTCAVHEGALKCWGRNTDGQLGVTGPNTATPQIALAAGVTAVSAARHHTCAIHQGALSCWGRGINGQLGDGAILSSSEPQLVFPSDVTAVAAGATHTCAIRAGALYCWGLNLGGQLGTDTNLATSTPTPTPQLVFASGVTAVAVGDAHTCAIHDGALACWGSNSSTQLGYPLLYIEPTTLALP